MSTSIGGHCSHIAWCSTALSNIVGVFCCVLLCYLSSIAWWNCIDPLCKLLAAIVSGTSKTLVGIARYWQESWPESCFVLLCHESNIAKHVLYCSILCIIGMDCKWISKPLQGHLAALWTIQNCHILLCTIETSDNVTYSAHWMNLRPKQHILTTIDEYC